MSMLQRRARPQSAMPAGRKHKPVPKKFSDTHCMSTHVERVFGGEIDVGRKCKCDSC